MDPNANLAEQERTLGELVMLSGENINAWRRRVRPAANRMRDLRNALSDWLRAGGFEPTWHLAPFARKYYRK